MRIRRTSSALMDAFGIPTEPAERSGAEARFKPEGTEGFEADKREAAERSGAKPKFVGRARCSAPELTLRYTRGSSTP